MRVFFVENKLIHFLRQFSGLVQDVSFYKPENLPNVFYNFCSSEQEFLSDLYNKDLRFKCLIDNIKG